MRKVRILMAAMIAAIALTAGQNVRASEEEGTKCDCYYDGKHGVGGYVIVGALHEREWQCRQIDCWVPLEN